LILTVKEDTPATKWFSSSRGAAIVPFEVSSQQGCHLFECSFILSHVAGGRWEVKPETMEASL